MEPPTTTNERTEAKLTSRIDPYSLRLFIAAANSGSILRAASQQHIAPSALSRRLADLEHAFGLPLLVRSPRGVTLTDAGRVVLARGMKFDEELQAMVREVQNETGELRGTVRLIANMSAVVGFLPERLKLFMQEYPAIKVQLHEADTRDVVRACLDERADLGVGVALTTAVGLAAWHFAADPLQVVLPLSHPLAKLRKIDFATVLQHPMIGVHQGGALDRQLHEKADAIRSRFEPAVSVSSFDAVCRMVQAGLGIAIIPQSAVSAFAGSSRFVRRPLNEPWAERELCLYALRRSPQPRPIQALLDSLRG